MYSSQCAYTHVLVIPPPPFWTYFMRMKIWFVVELQYTCTIIFLLYFYTTKNHIKKTTGSNQFKYSTPIEWYFSNNYPKYMTCTEIWHPKLTPTQQNPLSLWKMCQPWPDVYTMPISYWYFMPFFPRISSGLFLSIYTLTWYKFAI